MHEFTDLSTDILPVNVDGATPLAGLTDGGDGLLYGVASRAVRTESARCSRSTQHCPQFTVLHDFESPNGANPSGALLSWHRFASLRRDRAGGTDSSGATTNFGTIFSIARDGTGFVKLYSFDGERGFRPVRSAAAARRHDVRRHRGRRRKVRPGNAVPLQLDRRQGDRQHDLRPEEEQLGWRLDRAGTADALRRARPCPPAPQALTPDPGASAAMADEPAASPHLPDLRGDVRHRHRAPRRPGALDQARSRRRPEPRPHLPQGGRAQGHPRGPGPAASADAAHGGRMDGDLLAGSLRRGRAAHRRGARAPRQRRGGASTSATRSCTTWARCSASATSSAPCAPSNLYSATSVDQLPHMMASQMMFGHQFLMPVPDVDRTQLLRLHRRQSRGVGRLADERAGFRAARRGAQGAGRAVRRRRSAAHRVGGIADEYLPIRPGTDVFLLLALLKEVFATGARQRSGHLAAQLRRPRAAARGRGRVRRRAAGGDAPASRRARIACARARDRGRAARAGLRPGRRLHAGVRRAHALAHLLPQPGHRAHGRGGRHDVCRARRGPDARLRRDAATTTASARACGGSRNSATNCRSRRWPTRFSPAARDRFARSSRSPAIRCCRRPTARQLDRALAGLDFMVSVDPYLNETTRHAHLILPPTSPLEHGHYDVALSRLRGAQRREVRACAVRAAAGLACTITRSWRSLRCGCAREPGCERASRGRAARSRVGSGRTG